MIYTSYFAKYEGNSGVSIAGRSPKKYNGKCFPVLAPEYWFFKAYKDGRINKEEYTKFYYKEILNNLYPVAIFNTLCRFYENPVLLCWEKTGDFCHRHIVADWLSKNIDIKIKEIM